MGLNFGQTFGRLTVLREADRRKGHRRCVCLCECGAEVEVQYGNLLSGNTSSCGCLQRELVSARFSIHKETGTYLYRLWSGIKKRCLNPDEKGYPLYGGRGITIHAEWVNDYVAFATYVRETLGEKPSSKHSLDRENNNGNYVPGNLRWATPAEQSSNRRNNVLLTHGGITANATEWAAKTGISAGCLISRKRAGWSDEHSLSLPTKKRRT